MATVETASNTIPMAAGDARDARDGAPLARGLLAGAMRGGAGHGSVSCRGGPNSSRILRDRGRPCSRGFAVVTSTGGAGGSYQGFCARPGRAISGVSGTSTVTSRDPGARSGALVAPVLRPRPFHGPVPSPSTWRGGACRLSKGWYSVCTDARDRRSWAQPRRNELRDWREAVRGDRPRRLLDVPGGGATSQTTALRRQSAHQRSRRYARNAEILSCSERRRHRASRNIGWGRRGLSGSWRNWQEPRAALDNPHVRPLIIGAGARCICRLTRGHGAFRPGVKGGGVIRHNPAAPRDPDGARSDPRIVFAAFDAFNSRQASGARGSRRGGRAGGRRRSDLNAPKQCQRLVPCTPAGHRSG